MGKYRSIFSGLVNRVDLETGEVVSSRSLGVGGYVSMPRFCLVFEGGYMDLFRVMGHDGMLLMMSLSYMSSDNVVDFSVGGGWHLGLYEGLSEKSKGVMFRRSLRNLVKHNLMLSIDGGKRRYMINPECFYRGRSKSYVHVLRKWEQLYSSNMRSLIKGGVYGEK
jgi:hypothetical protein